MERFMYGTAWKKEETATCVSEAINSGFKAFDTACQPKHYREELVGEAIRQALADGRLQARSQIWIQTKFSRPDAQDPDVCPYDLSAPIEEQVHTSIKTSLHNLRHNEQDDETSGDAAYLDSLVLHSPWPIQSFEDTLRAWRTMSTYVPHKVRALGVSNISSDHLKQLYDAVEVKPAFVQNRFHERTDWEIAQREFCREKSIVFQAHRVLKQKEDMLASELVGEVSAVLGTSREVALYLCVLGLGDYMNIVNGTKSEEHMREDVQGLRRFKVWIAEPGNEIVWAQYVNHFKKYIGE